MLHKITLIEGDGVGPEVTKSVTDIISAASVRVHWDIQLAGKKVFEAGLPTGVPPETIESIKETKVALKGPLETPIGYGDKSANVTLRKLFETFANIRPAKNIPGVNTRFSNDKIDLVLVRENVEGLYTGIEHRLSSDCAQSLKAVSYTGCEKIARLAFEYARAKGRKKVTCVTKANIMKISEGMLKEVCAEIAQEYPTIDHEHMIVDNCAHQLVVNPEQFDVMVMTNLNGDILSDLCSGLVGGLGFAPSANFGNTASIFEAVHGSAPTIAGKDIVNPTSLILSSILMLDHIHEFEAAARIEKALHQTFLDGIFTADVRNAKKHVSTTEFTQAIIENLEKSSTLPDAPHSSTAIDLSKIRCKKTFSTDVKETGVDITLTWKGAPTDLGTQVEALTKSSCFDLKGISNRGLQVFPLPEVVPELTDSWQCRFVFKGGEKTFSSELEELIKIISNHFTWSKVVKLLTIDGKEGFSKTQGES